MVFGACASITHCTTWPSAPVTSSVSRQWGFDHSQFLTTPFSVTVVSDRSVEPVWCACSETDDKSPTTLKTITSLFLMVSSDCSSVSWLLAARGVSVDLVVGIDFHRRAVPCQYVDALVLQRHRYLHRLPRPRVDLRILERLGPFHRVVVEPAERLGDPRLVADRAAGVIEPHPVFRHGADRLDFERVVVDPSAH